jgi:DNA-binding NtrC family response regulator
MATVLVRFYWPSVYAKQSGDWQEANHLMFLRLSRSFLTARRRCLEEIHPRRVRKLATVEITARKGLFLLGKIIWNAREQNAMLDMRDSQDSLPALATLDVYKRNAERQALSDALARYGSNMSVAARMLGISRPTFYRLLHKHRLR